MTPIFVPAALIVEMLTDRLSGATVTPGTWRAVVAACVLGGGGSGSEWVSRESCRAGREIWPPGTLDKPGQMTPLRVLSELEALGVCRDIEPTTDGFMVRLCAKREVAA